MIFGFLNIVRVVAVVAVAAVAFLLLNICRLVLYSYRFLLHSVHF
jgi:hypothetical protein